jgi:hypothetical protein
MHANEQTRIAIEAVHDVGCGNVASIAKNLRLASIGCDGSAIGTVGLS